MNWAKIRRQLLADKRKVALMMSLLAVAMLLWGRLLLKDVPRSAVADPDENASASTQPDTNSAAPTDNVRLEVVQVRGLAPVERELFAFDTQAYPRIAKPQAKLDVDPKSGVHPTDEMMQQQAERMAVYAAARGLTLQSTLLGTRNRAMINGVLLEPGDTILGFELKSVGDRQVVLARDGVQVTLEM